MSRRGGSIWPLDNAEVARMLEQIADVLAISGANPFRIRSYRRVAQTVAELGESLAAVDRRGGLEGLPHVGAGMAKTLSQLVRSGTADAWEEAQRAPEARLVPLLAIPGVGPKQARLFGERLGVESIADLERAARAHELRRLEGLGMRSEAKILAAIQRARADQGRLLLTTGSRIAAELRGRLLAVDGVDRVEVAGSLRRWQETIGGIDLLATAVDPQPVVSALAEHHGVAEVLDRGPTSSSVRLRAGIRVGLHVVPPESFGAAFVHFTGSKAHNAALRERALHRGLRIDEFGVFRDQSGPEAERLGAATEEQVYRSVDLAWIPPVLREDRGEVAAAANGRLPALVELGDIRGDLQMHSTYSDGKNTIAEMAAAACELDYEYILVTDHSKRVKMANGLDEAGLREQWEEIEGVNRQLESLRILKGVEVDILADGSLDLDDDCLAAADIVVAAMHYDLDMAPEEMTERIVRALASPHVDIFAHPTARRLLERPECAFDLEKVLDTAGREGVLLECNATPRRLDLGDVYLRLAKARRVSVVISSDAHRTDTLTNMRYGVYTAQRGWLEAGDVANTRSLEELLKIIEG